MVEKRVASFVNRVFSNEMNNETNKIPEETKRSMFQAKFT